MSAENESPDGTRAVMTRRVLMAVGGLTLLGLWWPDGLPPGHDATPPGRTPPAQVDSLTRPAPTRPAPTRSASTVSVRTHSPAHRERAARRSGRRAGHRRAGDDQPMFYVQDGPRAIALTIDDGPNPVYTPQVLRLLDKHRVTATFSMVGIEVAAYPGLAREVAAAGHVIANHTWTHADLPWLPPVAIADQMNRATAAIYQETGRVPTLFRAPYGAWSPAVLRQCALVGMTPFDWSVDPRDWSRPGVSSIVSNIMRNTRTGSIILEHDGGGNRSQTIAALKIVLPRLLAAGYHFHTP